MENRSRMGLESMFLSTLRWATARLVRAPQAWLWAALLIACWPLVAAFTPVGMTTRDRAPGGALYEIAFWSALVGVASGLATVVRGRWFLAPLSTPRRLTVEAFALLAPTGLFLAAGLGGAALVGAPASASVWLGAGLCTLHLTAGGLLLLRLPLSPGVAVAVLVALAWPVPALLAGAAPPGPGIARFLDAGQHLAFSTGSNPAEAHRGAALLPIIGMVLAAALLNRPDALRRPG